MPYEDVEKMGHETSVSWTSIFWDSSPSTSSFSTSSLTSYTSSSGSQSLCSQQAYRTPKTRIRRDHLKHLDERFHRSNSASTLWADSSISTPKHTELIRWVALSMWQTINSRTSSAPSSSSEIPEILDERRHPLAYEPPEPVHEGIIERFVTTVYDAGKMSAESLLMSVAYLDRVQALSSTTLLTEHTWRRLTLSCMILGSKVIGSYRGGRRT